MAHAGRPSGCPYGPHDVGRSARRYDPTHLQSYACHHGGGGTTPDPGSPAAGSNTGGEARHRFDPPCGAEGGPRPFAHRFDQGANEGSREGTQSGMELASQRSSRGPDVGTLAPRVLEPRAGEVGRSVRSVSELQVSCAAAGRPKRCLARGVAGCSQSGGMNSTCTRPDTSRRPASLRAFSAPLAISAAHVLAPQISESLISRRAPPYVLSRAPSATRRAASSSGFTGRAWPRNPG